jgi:putative glutamine amidotransferase
MTQSPKKLPIVGITTSGRNETGHFCVSGRYGDAVQAAGGIPILLPPNQPAPARILDIVDGLIFAGGGDMDPTIYSGPAHPDIYAVDRERDTFELSLARLALTSEIPVLAICRGMQVFNVASGGDLVTHIPDLYDLTVPHRLDHPLCAIEHSIQIEPNSRLAAIIAATTATVASFHHQAVRTIPPTWQQVAWATDGVVEALEHQHHPWLIAVQWHPELSSTDPAQQRLFQSFVQAAEAYATYAQENRWVVIS